MFDRIAEGRWWDRAWSLVEGCTPCSPGCERCWLRAMERRFRGDSSKRVERGRHSQFVDAVAGKIRDDASRGVPVFLDVLPIFRGDRLPLPLRTRKPTAWAIWSDLFHPSVRPESLAEALDIMASWRCKCGRRHCRHTTENLVDPGHVYLALTKRPERIRQAIDDALDFAGNYFPGDCAINVHTEVTGRPLPNLWIGATVCNQEEADQKIPYLLAAPAAVRFVSYEPALGPIDFERALCSCPWPEDAARTRHLLDCPADSRRPESARRWPIDWIVAGGETGRGARPANVDWFRSVRDQAAAAGIPFLFKAWGEWVDQDGGHKPGATNWPGYDPGSFAVHRWGIGKGRSYRVGRKKAGRKLDGQTHNGIPAVRKGEG